MHHEYEQEGKTVKKQYYREVFRNLRYAVWHKKPELWTSHDWHLHHDNAAAHSSHLTQGFLAKYEFLRFTKLLTP